MIRFPHIQPHTPDDTLLVSGGTPYAKHNIITTTTGLQTGFLTEHTAFFILKGQKRFHFPDRVLTVGEHELILIKRGIYTISEQLSAGGVFEALMLFIPAPMLPRLHTVPLPAGHTPATEYVVVRKDALLTGFEHSYLPLFHHAVPQPQQLLPLKLQELALLLAATPQAAPVAAFMHGCISKEAFDIGFIVKEHLFHPLDIADYARLCCRSVASFKRDFEKQFHTPPRRWINEQRIAHAHSLLHTTALPIADIALQCGFESTSHFIKLYKAHYHTTPGRQRAI